MEYAQKERVSADGRGWQMCKFFKISIMCTHKARRRGSCVRTDAFLHTRSGQ